MPRKQAPLMKIIITTKRTITLTNLHEKTIRIFRMKLTKTVVIRIPNFENTTSNNNNYGKKKKKALQ